MKGLVLYICLLVLVSCSTHQTDEDRAARLVKEFVEDVGKYGFQFYKGYGQYLVVSVREFIYSHGKDAGCLGMREVLEKFDLHPRVCYKPKVVAVESAHKEKYKEVIIEVSSGDYNSSKQWFKVIIPANGYRLSGGSGLSKFGQENPFGFISDSKGFIGEGKNWEYDLLAARYILAAGAFPSLSSYLEDGLGPGLKEVLEGLKESSIEYPEAGLGKTPKEHLEKDTEYELY
jgi:hypothetical protein